MLPFRAYRGLPKQKLQCFANQSVKRKANTLLILHKIFGSQYLKTLLDIQVLQMNSL